MFALIYAAMGSFVSRPDDLQTLSLPLSLVAMVGYLTAIVALGGGGGAWVSVASFLPPFSPFVMLARIMVTGVEPWQVLLSIGLDDRGHRGRGGRGDADVRGRGAAVRDAAGDPGVRGGGAQGLRRGAERSYRSSSGSRLIRARTGAAAGPGTSSGTSASPSAPVAAPGVAAMNRHNRLRTPGR